MQRIEVNVLTGEQIIVDLTAEEIAQAQAMKAICDAEELARKSTPTLEQTIQTQAETINTLIARITALEAK